MEVSDQPKQAAALPREKKPRRRMNRRAAAPQIWAFWRTESLAVVGNQTANRPAHVHVTTSLYSPRFPGKVHQSQILLVRQARFPQKIPRLPTPLKSHFALLFLAYSHGRKVRP
jgi:hypothetical protein